MKTETNSTKQLSKEEFKQLQIENMRILVDYPEGLDFYVCEGYGVITHEAVIHLGDECPTCFWIEKIETKIYELEKEIEEKDDMVYNNKRELDDLEDEYNELEIKRDDLIVQKEELETWREEAIQICPELGV